MSAMSDQQVIINELFDRSRTATGLLMDLFVLPEETKKELEEHFRAIGNILAPIVDNIEILDE